MISISPIVISLNCFLVFYLKAASKKSSDDSSSSEEDDDSSSDEDESEDEKITKTPKSKDVKMVDAPQAVTKSEKKEVSFTFSCEILVSQSVVFFSNVKPFCSRRPQLIKVKLLEQRLFLWGICLIASK